MAAAGTVDRLAFLPDEIAQTFRVRLEEAQARAEDALRLWKEEWARYRDLKAAKARGNRPPSEILKDVRRKVSEYEERFRQTLSSLAISAGFCGARTLSLCKPMGEQAGDGEDE